MKEEEIRPKRVFDEYLRLAALDADIYFGNSIRQPVLCPACDSQGSFSFNKHGFSYEECTLCQTLFVSPRPPAVDFFRYYQESASASYFATTFYRETAEARREKLWRPKAAMVHDVLKRHGADKYGVFDIGGGYGIFAEEYQRLAEVNVTIIEPGPQLAQICREKGLTVVESFLENVYSTQLLAGPKVFVSFELFEHLHDCGVFLERLFSLMQPGDLFLFTTLSGMGVDIQALWNASNSISLQHLNFFNPKSVRYLLDRAGLRALTVETPGKLDLDILSNNRMLIKDRFWRNFIAQASADERQKWQQFIASHGFSSHMFVVCECPQK
jgi:2-polyprenyl-3-methyl-5-hydroxy-6-metoxy-1,4-benzoquinol methylase